MSNFYVQTNSALANSCPKFPHSTNDSEPVPVYTSALDPAVIPVRVIGIVAAGAVIIIIGRTLQVWRPCFIAPHQPPEDAAAVILRQAFCEVVRGDFFSSPLVDPRFHGGWAVLPHGFISLGQPPLLWEGV